MTQPDNAPGITILRVADLSQNRSTRFHVVPGAQARDAMAEDLGLLALRKLDFRGEVQADGKRDWRLDGQLGATAEQTCVVSLEPVVTRIDLPVTRRFVAETGRAFSEEMEMPEDDSQEPLGEEIDLVRVAAEALMLALPDYPRHPDAELAQQSFAAPGVTPLSDEDTKPFAGLAALKANMKKGDGKG